MSQHEKETEASSEVDDSVASPLTREIRFMPGASPHSVSSGVLKQVFVSYSKDDLAWHDRIIKVLGPLEMRAKGSVWSDRYLVAGDDWQKSIDQALAATQVAVLLVSQSFLATDFIMTRELPHLLEAREAGRVRILWVLLEPCLWGTTKLSELQAANDVKMPLKKFSGLALKEELTRIGGAVWREASPSGEKSPPGRAIPPRVRISRLPAPYGPLIGREDELRTLDKCWEDPGVPIASIVAIGGGGKSALVHRWLADMTADNFRGAERVFGWSFNSANMEQSSGASADEFINAALIWFGDPNPASGSAWERGERLADLIREHRTLLILDGFETLLTPPGTDEGRIQDHGATALVRELRTLNPGLCVITTRLSVADVNLEFGEIDLQRLGTSEGARLLRKLGVQGPPAEVRKAVEENEGHPLTLTLLGTYLDSRYNGSIRMRDLAPPLLATGQPLERHARGVLASYEDWFKETGREELQILRIVGMFNRPARGVLVEQLRSGPVIPGLNDLLVDLSDDQWYERVARLRRARLINDARLDQRGRATDPEALDAHAIVRDFFGERLQQESPDAWRAGHDRLYQYLIREPKKERPDTHEEMMPLLEALVHGCHAERHSEALHEVYWKRVCREQFAFHDRPIHAFRTMLMHLYGFCKPSSTEPLACLEEVQKAFVQEEIGHYRFLLGDYDAAIEPMEAGMTARCRQGQWQQASKYARLLRELHLVRGDFEGAIHYAEQSVEWAKHSELWQDDVTQLAGHGQVLAYHGHVDDAQECFERAERIHTENHPVADTPEKLYAYDGYWYCSFLLDQWKDSAARDTGVEPELLSVDGSNGKPAPSVVWDDDAPAREALQDIEQRARWIASMGDRNEWILEKALGWLAIADVAQCQMLFFEPGKLSEAKQAFDQAVNFLRREGQMHHLVSGLRNRAVFLRIVGHLAAAERDLQEMHQIAQRCCMQLYEADFHLEFSRWALARHQTEPARDRDWLEEARRSVTVARGMVGLGYRRRHREVAAVEDLLNRAPRTALA